MAFSALAKSGTRYYRHPLVMQQAFTEFIGSHTGRLDGWEHVKRPFRLKTFQSHLPESIHNETAAHIIFIRHTGNGVVTAAGCLDGSVLAGGRGAHNGILMDFEHLFHDRSRSYRISQPPAGHGVGLWRSR